MTVLPPPPPPLHPPIAGPAAPAVVLRAGQLTGAWRGVFIVGWGCVVLGLAAVWRTARTMGLSTWWLGAASTPQFFLVQVLPFVPAIGLVVLAARNVRLLPHLGIIGALALGAIAVGDLGRFEGLAALELTIAGAGLLVSVASFAGLLRRADQ